jgi:hypothetical protein
MVQVIWQDMSSEIHKNDRPNHREANVIETELNTEYQLSDSS